MTPLWIILFAGTTVLSAVGIVLVAALWLRKIRETVVLVLGEIAGQQIRSAKNTSEALAQIQKQQDVYAQQIRMLTQAKVQMQRELSLVATQLEDAETPLPRTRETLH